MNSAFYAPLSTAAPVSDLVSGVFAEAETIATRIDWYKSQNLVKADIKAADIIDTRYAEPIAHP